MSERRFLAEGPQAVREALATQAPHRGCVVEVFATPDAEVRHLELRAAASVAQVPWHLVEPPALAGLADTVNPQGVVAVCHFLDVPLDSLTVQQPRLVAVCADIRDPGNTGAVIRCADAAGADAVVLAGTSVDPYNGKVVRASAGSLFHLPIVVAPSLEASVVALRAAGMMVLAADAGGELSLDDAVEDMTLTSPTAWLFGNEARGLGAAETALADKVLRVPIYGSAESLNLATAAAVCLYASASAQRGGTRSG